MATKIFVHGSGHKATSWEKTISYMTNNEDIVCPNLSSILEGKEASYENLYSSFVKYCNEFDGQIHLCGLSLGGILALNFALDFPQKVKTLVLIGTPYKVPKVAFSFQNIIFRFLPKSQLVEKAALFSYRKGRGCGRGPSGPSPTCNIPVFSARRAGKTAAQTVEKTFSTV